jgi:hypothetical protein
MSRLCQAPIQIFIIIAFAYILCEFLVGESHLWEKPYFPNFLYPSSIKRYTVIPSYLSEIWA